MDKVVTGQEFLRPLENITNMWIVKGLLKFLRLVSPGLRHNISGERPSFLSPLMATAQTVAVAEMGTEAIPNTNVNDKTKEELQADTTAAIAAATTAVADIADVSAVGKEIPSDTTPQTSVAHSPPQAPRPECEPALPLAGLDLEALLLDLDRDQEEKTDLQSPTLLQASHNSSGASARWSFSGSADNLKRKKYFNKNENAQKHWFETENAYTFEFYQHIIDVSTYHIQVC
jgi:hypothetical protein